MIIDDTAVNNQHLDIEDSTSKKIDDKSSHNIIDEMNTTMFFSMFENSFDDNVSIG